ncbi:MAG TPA: PAS domain S-box protein, partial [Prolixibacteraceae bacterium]|nr:PAS domain S-box protein [Prolixibacteraceae bacterium]
MKQSFRQFFVNSSAVMLLIDPDNQRIIDANPAAEKYYGWSHDQITAMSIDQINTLSVNEIQLEIEKARKQQRTYFKFKHRRANGAVSPVEVFSSEVELNGKEYLHSIVHDISEQNEADKALKKSEEKYRYLFDNNPLPMWIYDLSTLRFLEVNNAAISYYGYSKVEFLSMTLKDIRPDEDLPLLLNDVKKTINNYNQAGVWRHIKKNGEIINVEIVSHKIDYEGHTARLVLVNDVSQRQKAENSLKHSHHLMRYIIEHDRSAIAVHDRDLNYVYVSQSYLKQYNVHDTDIIGKHHYDVFPDLPQKWRDVHQKALKGEVSSADRDIYKKEDGTLVYTRWECRPWYEADGSIGGIIIYTEVINDRIEKELEIKKLNERLEILVKSVQDLTAAKNIQNVQEIVVHSARKLLGSDGASVVFKENNQCFYAAEDAVAPLWEGQRFPIESCVSGWAMLNKKSLVIDDIFDDPRVPVENYRHTFVKSLTMVPINLNEPLGAIGNYWKTNYKPSDIEVAL